MIIKIPAMVLTKIREQMENPMPYGSFFSACLKACIVIGTIQMRGMRAKPSATVEMIIKILMARSSPV